MFLTGTVRLIACITAKVMLLPIELAFLLFYGACWYLLRKFCLRICINGLEHEVTGHS